MLEKLGIKNIKISYILLPQVSVKIHGGNVNVTNHWSKFGVDFELDEIFKQRIRNLPGNSIADVAEEAVIAQFTQNGFVPFLTKYGGNNGLDALLANSDDLATATRIIILEVKSSTTKNVPFNVKLGEGYGGRQMETIWLQGVISKMENQAEKSITLVGTSLRSVVETNPHVIEKYLVEVDNSALAKIIRVQ